MKLFLIKCLRFVLIGMIPFLVLLIGYCILDPFKVVQSYSDYSDSYVIPDRDYISTEMYIKNHEKYKYNSYVLGSSRTLGYRIASWKKFLPAGNSPFMFDASGESIYGIYIKLKYLDSIHAPIDNALIILCRDASFRYTSNHDGHLYIKHPATSLESSFAFQLCFFKAYLTPEFLFSFYYYTFTKDYWSFMADYISPGKIMFDPVTNEVNRVDIEKEITQTPAEYYKKRELQFYYRPGESIDTVIRITDEHMRILNQIENILEKNKTSFKVVISPLYDQVKLNPKDMIVLKSIFKDHLYDFSGKNSFTDNKYNFYESKHYRPNVGDSILEKIYK